MTDPNEDIVRRVIDNALLLQLGERIVAIIQARTVQGKFLPGSTTRGYSTKDAPMPLGGLAERVGKGVAGRVFRELQGEEGKIFTSKKSGKVWLMLTGGYKRLRELAGRETDRVTLNWSGAMLRALHHRGDIAAQQVVIYFSDARSEEIASFHHEGAGRSKIKRLFLGLTQQEQERLERWAEGEIPRKFRFQTSTS